MKYNVKGITFTMDELKSLPILDVKTATVSRSHLIHFLPGGQKPMILLRAGDYVEQSFVANYYEKGLTNIYQLEVVSQEMLNVYRSFWNQLRNCKVDTERLQVRDEMMKKIAIDYWSNQEECFLTFVITCFEEFHAYPNFVMEKIQNQSMILYSRALLTSSVAILTALCLDYVDYFFLKDFYNTSFIMDYGLVEYEAFNYTLSLACEAERKKPGTGLALMQRMRRPEGEVQTFKQHPNVSYEFAITQSESFTYPEVLDVVKMHHEKADGTGFPGGYSYAALSDTETLLMFADYMIPFSEHVFKDGDGHIILFSYFEELKKMEGKDKLPIAKIIFRWEAMMKWASDQAKLAQEEKKKSAAPQVDEDAFGEAS